jgi:hypothetical protein
VQSSGVREPEQLHKPAFPQGMSMHEFVTNCMYSSGIGQHLCQPTTRLPYLWHLAGRLDRRRRPEARALQAAWGESFAMCGSRQGSSTGVRFWLQCEACPHLCSSKRCPYMHTGRHAATVSQCNSCMGKASWLRGQRSPLLRSRYFVHVLGKPISAAGNETEMIAVTFWQ